MAVHSEFIENPVNGAGESDSASMSRPADDLADLLPRLAAGAHIRQSALIRRELLPNELCQFARRRMLAGCGSGIDRIAGNPIGVVFLLKPYLAVLLPESIRELVPSDPNEQVREMVGRFHIAPTRDHLLEKVSEHALAEVHRVENTAQSRSMQAEADRSANKRLILPNKLLGGRRIATVEPVQKGLEVFLRINHHEVLSKGLALEIKSYQDTPYRRFSPVNREIVVFW
jgi:hypothetical protein